MLTLKLSSPITPLLTIALTVRWPRSQAYGTLVSIGVGHEKALRAHGYRAVVVDPLGRADARVWRHTGAVILAGLFAHRYATVPAGPLCRARTGIGGSAVPTVGASVGAHWCGAIRVVPAQCTRARVWSRASAPVHAVLHA